MITLAILALVMMPTTVTAQTEEFKIIGTRLTSFEAGFFVDTTANWFEVMMIVTLDEMIIDQVAWVGGNPLNMLYEFYFTPFGLEFGSSHKLTIEYINATAWFEDIDTTGRTVDVPFIVPYPSVVDTPEVAYPEPTEPEWEPYATYEEVTSNFLIASATIVLLIMGWCCLAPVVKPKKTRRWKSKHKWKTYKKESKSVKDAINTVTMAELNDDKVYENPVYKSEAEAIADHMAKEFAMKVEVIQALYNDTYEGPPPDAKVLPDLSSDEDGWDWRTCPYCGEWNKGKATRCINCDGRLGRPLEADKT